MFWRKDDDGLRRLEPQSPPTKSNGWMWDEHVEKPPRASWLACLGRRKERRYPAPPPQMILPQMISQPVMEEDMSIPQFATAYAY